MKQWRGSRKYFILFLLVLLLQPACIQAASTTLAQVQGPPEFILSEEELQYIQELGTITVAADDNFIPLSKYSQSENAYTGASVELFETIADLLGLSYEYVYVDNTSWNEKMEAFRQGRLQILFPTSKTESRMDYGHYSLPYYTAYYCIITNSSNPAVIENLDDLKDRSIGVVKETSIIDDLIALGFEKQLVYFDSDEKLYNGLKRKEVDFGSQNEIVFIEDYYTKELFYLKQTLRILESPKEYCYFIQKDSRYERLVELINRGIQFIDSEQLIEKYSMSQMERMNNYMIENRQKNITIAALAVVAAFAALFVNLFAASRKKAAAYEHEARINELAYLQAQIKPHFLYNTLSAITGLCSVDPEQAGRLTVSLSKYLRIIFNSDNQSELISLENEIQLMELYLEINQIRHQGRLEYELHIDVAEDILIPPLMIEPIVENAVKHGALQRLEGGSVVVGIREADGFLISEISDDGVGMSPDQLLQLNEKLHEVGGVGLANISRRLRAYGGSIAISSGENQGTRVELAIPIRREAQI